MLLKVQSRYSKCLKEYLSSLNAIVNVVVWRLRQKDRVVLRVDIQLLKDVTPDLLHVVPVSYFTLDAAMLNRVP